MMSTRALSFLVACILYCTQNEADAFLCSPSVKNGRQVLGKSTAATAASRRQIRPRNGPTSIGMTSTAPPQPERSSISGQDFDNWFWGDAHVKGGVEHAVFQQSDSAVVLFDGECNFCNSGVWMMLANSDERNMRFCAQNTEVGLSLLHSFGQDVERLSSIALLDKNGHLHTRSDAVIEIISRMQLPYPVVGMLLHAIPVSVRDAMYSWVSRRRHIFGTETQLCRIPEDDEVGRFLL